VVTDPALGTRPRSVEELDRRGGRVLREHSEGVNKRRLWDCVGQSWTAPLRTELAIHKVEQVIFKCSACSFVTMYSKAGEGVTISGGTPSPGNGASKNGVRSHATRILRIGEEHRGAKVERVDERDVCSACGASYERFRRMGFCQRHIDEAQAQGQAHSFGVRQVTMKLYSLGPSEPVVMHVEDALAPVHVAGADVNQLVEDAPRRVRKRRRSRNRRRR
jgi:hypothetical protein